MNLKKNWPNQHASDSALSASTVTGMEEMDETMDMEDMMDTATVCAQIPQLTHGKSDLFISVS